MGTIRDINESTFKLDGIDLHFMDTAGLRRRKKLMIQLNTFQPLELNGPLKMRILSFLIDAEELLTDQDKKIINHIFSLHKNCLIFVNKWDLLARNDNTRNDIIKILEFEIPQLTHYPIIMGSALEKHNIHALLETIISVVESSKERIQTADLNNFLKCFSFIIHRLKKAKCLKYITPHKYQLFRLILFLKLMTANY